MKHHAIPFVRFDGSPPPMSLIAQMKAASKSLSV